MQNATNYSATTIFYTHLYITNGEVTVDCLHGNIAIPAARYGIDRRSHRISLIVGASIPRCVSGAQRKAFHGLPDLSIPAFQDSNVAI